MAVRMLGCGKFSADARNQACAGRTQIVRMQVAGIHVAIPGISKFTCPVVVQDVMIVTMGIMRVAERRIVVGMHLDHRNARRHDGQQQYSQHGFARKS